MNDQNTIQSVQMTLSLDFVLLIDDNPATNVRHGKLIREAASVQELVQCESAASAIDFLKNRKEEGGKLPDLIFLDLNMPGSSGWDFLEAYRKRFGTARHGSVVMLTSTGDVRDMIRCAVHPEVQDYITKPLTDVETRRVFEQYSLMGKHRLN